MHLTFSPVGSRTPARSRAFAGRRSAIAAAAVAGLLFVPATASAVDRTATTSTFASVVAASQGGDRILLASGDYGTFSGVSKSSMLTIAAQPGAVASMYPSMTNASNLTFDGLT